MNHYDWLVSRLDAFVRKYYVNQLLRGALILLILVTAFILTASVSEYYLYLPVWLRVSLVAAFITIGGGSLIWLVIRPLVHIARLGKIITHEQAAVIVGKHFPEISDKLLNILQLKKQSAQYESRELIEASIDQKASQISVVPITRAIDFSRNRKLLPYLLPLLLIGIFILVAAPNVFKDASERLLQPTRSFEKPAPFRFEVLTEPLQVVRNSDFLLKIKTTGAALPAEMYIEFNNERIPMQAGEGSVFQYQFRNVSEDVPFRLFAAGYYSSSYILKVVQKPVLKAIKAELDYPAYIGKKNEVRSSLGDITIPAGTTIRWALYAEHTDNASIRFEKGSNFALPKSVNLFAYQYRFLNDTSYTLFLHNNKSDYTDSFRYHVQVIPDQYPVLQVAEMRDTVAGKQIVLTGTAGDDYGITKVLFHYKITGESNQTIAEKNIPLKITSGALTTFQHYFDVSVFKLQPGQKLSYFVEAWDNDGVHGSKASRSELMTWLMYDGEQLDSVMNATADQINSGISNSAKQSKELQEDYKEMQNKMLQSDDMDWQQTQSLEELSQKQQQLQQQVEQIKKRFEEQIAQTQQKQHSEDLKEKQEELKKQLDNLMSNELKEQMRKLQELMQKLNKDQAVQTMKQLEQENKLFNMDMKRMEELMKQLEMQMRLEDMANKMEDLAKKELDLKKETDKGAKENESLRKSQEDIKKELDKTMKEDMAGMKELNEKSDKKQDLDQPKEQGKEAGEQMQQSEQSLQQNQKSKASQSQGKAAQNLQDMADKMRQMAGGISAEQIDIDIKATRQILTNLMRLSFDQEQLMATSRETSPASQSYVTNQKEQSRLHQNSLMIRDSLFVLSKRIFKLSAMVNKETTDLEKHMKAATNALEARRISEANTRQQYVMTHTNNLALMLNELLSNLMQMQSQSMKAGSSGSCMKPGGSNPKSGAGQQLGDIITKQQQLGDAMQQMQNAGKPGGKPPGDKGEQGQQQGQGQKGKQGSKPGGKEGQGGGAGGEGSGEDGENGDAEQIARMAEQQANIRRQIQQLNSLLNSKGMGANARELREIQQQMDKNETDLVNRRFTSEMVMRQRQILTRLLETEKSIRNQEQDDKRSSHSAEEIARPVPPELQKFLNDKKDLMERYRTVPPQLKPYYKAMVDQYYKILGNE